MKTLLLLVAFLGALSLGAQVVTDTTINLPGGKVFIHQLGLDSVQPAQIIVRTARKGWFCHQVEFLGMAIGPEKIFSWGRSGNALSFNWRYHTTLNHRLVAVEFFYTTSLTGEVEMAYTATLKERKTLFHRWKKVVRD